MSNIGVKVVTPPAQKPPHEDANDGAPAPREAHPLASLTAPVQLILLSNVSLLPALCASSPQGSLSVGKVTKIYELKLLHIAQTLLLRHNPTTHSIVNPNFCLVALSFLPSPLLAVSLLELMRTTHGLVVQELEEPGIRQEIVERGS